MAVQVAWLHMDVIKDLKLCFDFGFGSVDGVLISTVLLTIRVSELGKISKIGKKKKQEKLLHIIELFRIISV